MCGNSGVVVEGNSGVGVSVDKGVTRVSVDKAVTGAVCVREG